MRRSLSCAATLVCLVGCGGRNEQAAGDGSESAPVAGSPAPASSPVSPPMAAISPTREAPTTPMDAQPAATPSSAPTPQAGPTPGGASTPPAPAMAPPAPAEPAAPVVRGIAPPEGFKPNAMDECGLHTQWRGDEYCILPPPAGKGFQLHIGPSNYENPEAEYVLQPGQEYVQRFENTSDNDEDIQFYVRQYRMRPGAHHTIVRDTSTGRRLSGSDVNQDHPVGGIIAPENAGVGIPLAAHSPISTDHHAINTTEEPLLQEVWVNFWYVDPAKVTETTTLLYDPGSVTEMIEPHADVVMGPWSCDIESEGRLINMFGHVHANDVRFSAWRTRAGKRDLIYESYHWEEPLWLEFTSLAKNPATDALNELDGGWTGILDLKPGDTIDWECHEVNEQDTALRFTNQTYTGWMCIIIGELVGTKCVSRNSGIPFDPSNE